MNIGTEIKLKLKDKTAEIQELVQKKKALENQLKDEKLDDRYKQTTVLPKMQIIRGKIYMLQGEMEREVDILVDDHKAKLIESRRLNGEQVNDDARLFGLGVVLPPEEIEAIFDRNIGNSTMQRLACMYANQNKISINRTYIDDVSRELSAVAEMKGTAKMYIDHWCDKENAYDMLDKFFIEV